MGLSAFCLLFSQAKSDETMCRVPSSFESKSNGSDFLILKNKATC